MNIPRKNNLSIWQKLLISITSIIVFCVILEIVLRFLNFTFNIGDGIPAESHSRDIIKRTFGNGCIPSKVLGYELEPNFEGEMWNTWVKINSQGFRDREFSCQKSPNTLRIVCLGDSSTFGVKVKLDDTYAKKIERILNKGENTSNYEVLNLGCAGYTSFMGLKMLEDKNILTYSPDIIFVYFGLIDEWKSEALSDSDGYKLRNLSGIFQKSRLYTFLRKVIREKILKNNTYLAKKMERLTTRVLPKEFKENLERINDIARKQKIKLLFITYPVKPDIFPGGEFKFYTSYQRIKQYNDIIREVSQKYDVPLVDLEKIFTQRFNNNSKLFADFCHPSDFGHTIIAQEIVRKLVEKNFIYDSVMEDYHKDIDASFYDFRNNIDTAFMEVSENLTPTLDGCVINGDFRYGIYQHAPSRLTYAVTISPAYSKLKFGISLLPFSWLLEGDGVKFIIAVDEGEDFQTIFSKYIDPKNNPDDRKWHDFVIDITQFRDKNIRIVFQTLQGHNNIADAAIWSEPKIE